MGLLKCSKCARTRNLSFLVSLPIFSLLAEISFSFLYLLLPQVSHTSVEGTKLAQVQRKERKAQQVWSDQCYEYYRILQNVARQPHKPEMNEVARSRLSAIWDVYWPPHAEE